MSGSKERLSFITIAQVFSMILIVLSHSTPSHAEQHKWMISIVQYLQKAGLTVFMVLSGFLVSYTGQLEKYGTGEFIRRRTIRLLIPYFTISFLMLLPKFLLSKYVQTQTNFGLGGGGTVFFICT